MSSARFQYENNVGGSFGNKVSDAILGTNKEATAKANYQMKFQEHMFDRQLEADNTAVQRKVADMKAAGINPMINSSAAASGAATPGGASGASVGGTDSGMLIGQAKKLVDSAMKPLNKILDGSAAKELLNKD